MSKTEENELVTNCNQQTMRSSDRNFSMCDIVDIEHYTCLLHSIPLPKEKPFKRWLSPFAREKQKEIDIQELYNSNKNWISEKINIQTPNKKLKII